MAKGFLRFGRQPAGIAVAGDAALPRDAASPRRARSIPGREAGQLLGGVYPVLRRLGEGGFGEVFLCRHPTWNVEVAVKVPKAEALANPRTLPDLEHEAEDWTGLGLHPFIAYCYHVHPLEGVPFLVVEYVSGGTLRGRIGNSEALNDFRGNLDLAIELCHALEHAHGKGIIHRDLKPENILISVEGHAKLTDFGIARRGLVEGEKGAIAGVMQSGYVGSAGYMAPEQAIAGAGIDGRADLYALGACLYELFCSALPYSGQAAGGKSPLSPQGLRRDQALPEGLDPLLRRLASIDPSKRPESARAVREELARIYRTAYGAPSAYADLPELSLTASGHNNRGVSYHYLGKEAEAEAAFKEALEADPLHPEAKYNLGLMQWRRGEITDLAVVRDLEQTRAALGGWRPDHLLGLVHHERHDREAAIASLVAAAESAPQNPGVGAALQRAKRMTDEQAVRLLRTFEGHKEAVTCAAFSPDGQNALSGSWDQTLRLWDIASGDCIRVFDGHGSRVRCVTFSHDGVLALSGDWNGKLCVWDTGSGRCVAELAGHTADVVSVDVAADGRRAVSGSWDKTIVVWDIVNRSALSRFSGHKEWVFSVVFSPDGQQVVSGAADGTLRVWDVTRGEQLRCIDGRSSSVTSCALSLDGRFALAGNSDGALRLWSLIDGECSKTLEGHGGRVTSVAFCEDDRRAVSSGADSTIRYWDLTAGRCLRSIVAQDRGAGLCALSLDGRRALTGGNNAIKLWWLGETAAELAEPQLAHAEPLSDILPVARRRAALLAEFDDAIRVGRVRDAMGAVEALEALPGQRREPSIVAGRARLASICSRGRVRGAWARRSLAAPSADGNAVAVSADSESAIVGHGDGTLTLCDLTSGACLRRFRLQPKGIGSRDSITAVSLAATGRHAISAQGDRIALWTLADDQPVLEFQGHTDVVTSLAYSLDSKRVISGGYDKTIRLWDAASGECLRVFRNFGSVAKSVVFSPGSRMALFGFADATLGLWDLRSARCVRIFKGHQDQLSSLAFSSDGRLALSGSWDRAAALWDVATGNRLRLLEGHKDGVTTVAFSKDRRHMLTGSVDGAARIWRVDDGECLHVLGGNGRRIVCVSWSDDPNKIVIGNTREIQTWHIDWELSLDSKI